MLKARHRTLFFLLFFISGFTGLIYESIWTHYLKLFLGHAAYAQTLVLTIFVGGGLLVFALAVLSREMMVVFPALLVGYELFLGDARKRLPQLAAEVSHDQQGGRERHAHSPSMPPPRCGVIPDGGLAAVT